MMAEEENKSNKKSKKFFTWKIFFIILLVSGIFLSLMWTNQFGSYFDRELLLSQKDNVEVQLKRQYDVVQEELDTLSVDGKEMEKMPETESIQKEKQESQETQEDKKPSESKIIGINTKNLITWVISTLNGLMMLALGFKKLFGKSNS